MNILEGDLSLKTIRSFTLAMIAGFALATVPGLASAQHSSAPKARVSAERANAIALKRYPGRVTGKTKLENEEGVWQYGVMVQSGKTLREVMVNASTGKIDSVEITSKEKEAKEQASEVAAAKHKAASSHNSVHGAAAHK
jgi:hypothetical protein